MLHPVWWSGPMSGIQSAPFCLLPNCPLLSHTHCGAGVRGSALFSRSLTPSALAVLFPHMALSPGSVEPTPSHLCPPFPHPNSAGPSDMPLLPNDFLIPDGFFSWTLMVLYLEASNLQHFLSYIVVITGYVLEESSSRGTFALEI